MNRLLLAILLGITLGQARASGQVRDASRYEGSDACAKIQAAIQDLPSDGGTVDARALVGNLRCHSSPVEGVKKSVLLLLGSANWVTDAPWSVPGAVVIRGSGRPSATGSGTTIKASASFPRNTAVVRLGTGDGFAPGARVETLRIDCDNLPGSIGVYSNNAAEQTGVYFIGINNCAAAGIRVEGTNSQFYSFENVEIVPGKSATPASNGIHIHETLPGIIRNVTVNKGRSPNMNAAVLLDGVQGGTFETIHGEFVDTVLQVGNKLPVKGIVARNISGSLNGPVTNVVLIPGLPETNGVTLEGINTFGAKYAINDQKNSVTLSGPQVGLFTLGEVWMTGGAPGDRLRLLEPLVLGAQGTPLRQIRVHEKSLDVGLVPANSTVEQIFTVNGLAITDQVFVNALAYTPGLIMANVRVVANDRLAVVFANLTGASMDPAPQNYRIVAIRN